MPRVNTKLYEKVLNKRMRMFQRFLQAITRSEILKTSKEFHYFLTETDQTRFEKNCKTIQTSGAKKQISEFLIEGGKANVELNQEAVVFCAKAKDYYQRQQELFQECIDVGKDIESKASNLRKSFFNMGQAW